MKFQAFPWQVRTYCEEKHNLIPWSILSVKDRMGMKQLPGFLRRALDLPERFRKGHALFMPIEVEECMNDVLERMVAGSTRTLQNAGSMKPQVLLQTASKLLKSWRDLYLKSCEENASNQKNAGRTSPTTSGCRDSFTAGSGAGKLPTQRGAISPMTQRRWLRWERHTRHKDWLRKPHGRWHWTLTRCGELGTNLQAKSYTKDVAKGMRMMIVSCLQRMSWASGWKPCSKWWKGRCREGWVEPTNRRSERLWPGQIMSRVAELAWLPSVPLGEMGNSVLSEFAWLQDRSGLPWSLISMLHTTVMSSFSNPAPNPILMNAETTLLYLRNLIGPATLSKDSDHIYIYVYIYMYIYIYVYR